MASKRNREAAFSSSSSSTSRWKYHVFLSFRGDTRKSFTDHLYAAFIQAGIHAYRDNNEMERGKDIMSELLQSIEESKFSIIVFSRDYASSTWCLDELVHILKCKATLGQTVIPVFYDVEPSDVRKQKGSFGEAFARHEERFKEDMGRVDGWRAALTEVANLKGMDLLSHPNGHESEFIWDIVNEISNKINPVKLSVAIHPVGLHSRADKVISLLQVESYDVRIVAIYGMGGIGKTTIAKEVYNSIFRRFEGSSFLANVKENSEKPNGMVRLQEQLLHEILKKKFETIYNVDIGLGVIEERLCHKRVLIVLDDVDQLEQLHTILGNRSWLCSGSRIIITTRVEGLLNQLEVYRQYKVEELNVDESLELFCFNAFNQYSPIKDYIKYSKNVVHYARGIPLALEVLGSSLSGKSVNVWESTLQKLKAIPHNQIQKKLKISYDSLHDDMEKDIFLDIACFFIGKDKDYVVSILDGCGFFSTVGIDSLIRRCLLSVSRSNRLVMHDLIRDMAREIVRKQCIKEPGKRSRVWLHEEAFDLLTEKTGTKTVEGLSINLPGSSEFVNTKAFVKMKKLRLLRLNHVHLTGCYGQISKKLSWLCWREFSLESIPNDLHLGNLVVLDMRYSGLKHLWEGVKSLGKLKILNLNHSHELTKTPDVKGLLNLEILLLKDCISLVEVHESIGLLAKLVSLNMKGCKNLRDLPESISMLRSLEVLTLSACSKLDLLPEGLGNMESLTMLEIDETAITRLPPGIGNLKFLESLSLRACQLISSPKKDAHFLSLLPACLIRLDISYCNLMEDFIPSDLGTSVPSLQELNLCGNNFSSIPNSIGSLPQLRHILLDNCKRLQIVPKFQSSLLTFCAEGCTSLERINLVNFPVSSKLNLIGCHKLVEVEGFFKMEPIGIKFVEEVLGIQGLLKAESVESVRVKIINTLTETSKNSPLQGIYELGIYSIFLPGSEIPVWFTYQSTGDSISFNLPPLHQGNKILGFIVCIVYAWEESVKTCCICPQVLVTNKTKMFDWIYEPKLSAFLSNVGEDITWLSYWRFENNMQGRDDYLDMNWRFVNEMDGGDQVEVSVDMGYGIMVKKCGVHLICQKNDQDCSQSNDAAMPIPCASYVHRKRIPQSLPKLLTIDHCSAMDTFKEEIASRTKIRVDSHDKSILYLYSREEYKSEQGHEQEAFQDGGRIVEKNWIRGHYQTCPSCLFNFHLCSRSYWVET